MKHNAFYGNCIHLKWMYPVSTYIGNSHSKVIAYCEIFKVDVYKIKRTDDLPMCCVSNSPYQKQNCTHFKDKSNQTQLSAFIS